MRRNAVTLIIILALLAFVIVVLTRPLFGRETMRLGLDLQGGIHLAYQADLSSISPGQEDDAIAGAMTVIERRVDILGVTEPVIHRQGPDRIVVELPGIREAERAKRLIGETALLEFREQITDEEGETRWVTATTEIDGLERELTSAYFKENTYVTRDDFGRVLLIFEWNREGSQLSGEITGRLIGQPLGIYLSNEPLLGDDGRPIAPIVRSNNPKGRVPLA